MAHEKRTELCRRFELRDGIEFFERRGEGICQTPASPGSEFFELRIEIQVVDALGEMLRRFERLFDKGLVNHELRFVLGDQAFFPRCDLLAHRFEIALHPVDADCAQVGTSSSMDTMAYARERPIVHTILKSFWIPSAPIRFNSLSRQFEPYRAGQ
jgi:hypothetical protein